MRFAALIARSTPNFESFLPLNRSKDYEKNSLNFLKEISLYNPLTVWRKWFYLAVYLSQFFNNSQERKMPILVSLPHIGKDELIAEAQASVFSSQCEIEPTFRVALPTFAHADDSEIVIRPDLSSVLHAATTKDREFSEKLKEDASSFSVEFGKTIATDFFPSFFLKGKLISVGEETIEMKTSDASDETIPKSELFTKFTQVGEVLEFIGKRFPQELVHYVGKELWGELFEHIQRLIVESYENEISDIEANTIEKELDNLTESAKKIGFPLQCFFCLFIFILF